MKNARDRLNIRFGLRCKQLRSNMGLSQLDFSQLIGMDRSYYASIEVGDRNITLQSMDKIAHGFGVSLATLVEGIDQQDSDVKVGF